jgi:hypothetical protein
MAIQTLYPTIKPSLNLDFANTKALDPRITFTRTTTAAYYDGKTVAKAEENLLIRSQEFDNASSWATAARVTISANSTTAPDGTSTAETMTEVAVTGTHRIEQNCGSLPLNRTYTLSCYFKIASGSPYAALLFSDGAGTNSARAWFKLSDGTLGSTAATGSAVVSGSSITAVGNDWYRCTVTGSPVTGISPLYAYAFIADADLNISYAGDVNRAVYIWGAQVEQRSAVTAYTPTTTQPITNYIPVLQTAAAGQARFDHNPVTGESLGLLVEEQRTNLFERSQEFDDAYWTKNANSAIRANQIIAPDGTLTGDEFYYSASGSSDGLQRSTFSSTSGAAYTLSCYAKAGSLSSLSLGFFGSFTSGANASFNLSTGTVASQSSGVVAQIVSVGNGWYRCAATLSSASTTGSSGIVLIYVSGSKSLNENLFLWGAQLEAGAFPTSYIPTVAATVTRNADVASMTGTNFSSWYRADEGTLYSDYILNGYTSGTGQVVFTASNNTTLNYITISTVGSPRTSGFQVQTNNSAQATIEVGTPSVSTAYKVAGCYKVNDFAASANGAAVVTDTSGTLPIVDRAYLGGLNDAALIPINGTIKKLAYYPARLSNANLQALTV